jgi:hypothetical protein
MKRLFLLLVLITLIFITSAFADRDTATVTTYETSALVKRGDAKIYSISFVATSNSGNFIIYDAVSATSGYTDVKAEGQEATSLNSQYQDFSNKPLELGTGLYLAITNGYVILRYE